MKLHWYKNGIFQFYFDLEKNLLPIFFFKGLTFFFSSTFFFIDSTREKAKRAEGTANTLYRIERAIRRGGGAVVVAAATHSSLVSTHHPVLRVGEKRQRPYPWLANTQQSPVEGTAHITAPLVDTSRDRDGTNSASSVTSREEL